MKRAWHLSATLPSEEQNGNIIWPKFRGANKKIKRMPAFLNEGKSIAIKQAQTKTFHFLMKKEIKSSSFGIMQSID